MLYIYRASAGSGKTHLLTGFFIELLFNPQKTPSLQGRDLQFDEILAVTFTNKATAEMKERIIADIYQLSIDPKKSAYYDKLTKTVGSNGKPMSDETIRKRAQGILAKMLNNYSDLHISTIDSFFQQVIRSFAHELNLQSNYELELKSDAVLDHAVSEFLLGLNEQNDKMTFDWVLEFNRKRLSDGMSYDVHKDLLKLTKVLTSEIYRKQCDSIREFTSDRQQMSDYTKMLLEIIDNWKKEAKRIGTEGTELLQKYNLQLEDFAHKGEGFFAMFAKMANGVSVNAGSRLINSAEDPEKWFTKANKKKLDELSESAIEDLKQILCSCREHLCSAPYVQMMSAQAIRKNFYQLGLLSKLEESVDKYCQQKGVKLISSTTQLLNALVGHEDSPFIYEKTGTRIQSYMIDEFQDTSGMQWENFAPLLRNSLGDGNQNLIVGDVKQSIYRWRGGDWELLNSRINDFMCDYHTQDEKGNKLTDNWRSDRSIIEFNNSFFDYASKRLSDLDPSAPEMKKIADIYSDAEQYVPQGRIEKCKEKGMDDIPQGNVYYEPLDGDKENAILADAMSKLPEIVIRLQQKGYQPKQILILCRKGKHCQMCAETLLAYRKAHPDTPYGFDIITNEALCLGNRQIIVTMINLLHALHEPKSEYRQFIAACSLLSTQGLSMGEAINRYTITRESPNLEQLLNVPLYEMVQRLMGLLPEKVREENASFLQAFCDIVLDFCKKEGPSLDLFLSWWEEFGSSKSITTPNSQNAIRIMTIHASKGLGEDAVIVPYASWPLDIDTKHSNIIWCQPESEPFSRNGLIVPVELSSTLTKTIFHKDFSEERLRAIIDNINMAYVAFTRAKHELVIMAPAPSKSSKKNSNLENFLSDFADSYKKLTSLLNEDIEQKPVTADTGNADSAVSHPHEETLSPTVVIPTEPTPVPELKIKRSPYAPDDGPVARGNTLHDALSAVHDISDIDDPVRQLFESGQAEAKGISLDEAIQIIHDLLKKPEVAKWYDPHNTVLNERNIVTHTTHTQRPDRVVITPDGEAIVIDYKTGAEHEKKHHEQVLYYMKLLRMMNFQNVSGYLWYFETDSIVPVLQQQE